MIIFFNFQFKMYLPAQCESHTAIFAYHPSSKATDDIRKLEYRNNHKVVQPVSETIDIVSSDDRVCYLRVSDITGQLSTTKIKGRQMETNIDMKDSSEFQTKDPKTLSKKKVEVEVESHLLFTAAHSHGAAADDENTMSSSTSQYDTSGSDSSENEMTTTTGAKPTRETITSVVKKSLMKAKPEHRFEPEVITDTRILRPKTPRQGPKLHNHLEDIQVEETEDKRKTRRNIQMFYDKRNFVISGNSLPEVIKKRDLLTKDLKKIDPNYAVIDDSKIFVRHSLRPGEISTPPVWEDYLRYDAPEAHGRLLLVPRGEAKDVIEQPPPLKTTIDTRYTREHRSMKQPKIGHGAYLKN
eukprot:GHVH01016792.1.p1 GENE.GHVH01016792.1~~GHVH01016792.1.p1  ORF type:complete len:354 (-),score=40.96 GHVH01016792.1:127-1188(-)